MNKYIVLILASICLFSATANALNKREIIIISRALARDSVPTSGTPRVAEVVVSSYVNIAQHEIAMFTWCNETTADIPIVLGQREYSYPSDMVAPERLVLDGNHLSATSITKLDSKYSDTWQANLTTGTPTAYYVDSGRGVIGFDTIPSTTTDKTISVTYIQEPTALINDTDIPFNGQTRLIPFHYTICLWVAAMICYQDNRGAEGDRYWQFYVDRVKNMSASIRLNSDYAPSFGGK